MPEILAPAGSMETLRAAIRSGADAVYAGGKRYSARSSAANLTDEELSEALRYCRLYGAKLYLAVNTIISDQEAPRFAEYIRLTSELGVDGYIVQDWGAAAIIRRAVPDAVIHASTQMSVHTAAGARLLKELGYARVVPARELDKSALARICREDIEVEVFVHGALCMSVSGQCYMSAMIGSRSANRGCCGQACRLPFSACRANGRAALSLKDLSLLPVVEELNQIGVCSLKIEGRMKRPEYVASAVNELKKALSGQKPDMDLLRGVFSRSGFTDGYFTGERRNMFGVREKEDVTAAQSLLPGIHQLYRSEKGVRKAFFRAVILPGEPVSVTAECGEISVTVTGDVPAAAQNRPTDAAAVEKQLSKLGDTVFVFGGLEAQIGKGLFVPAGALNELRRRAASELSEAVIRSEAPKYTVTQAFPELPEAPRRGSSPLPLRAVCTTAAQAEAAAPLAAFVAVPVGIAERCALPKEKTILSPPRFITDEEALAERLRKLREQGFDRLSCHTPDHIAIGRELGFKLHGSSTLNVYNSFSAEYLRKIGLEDCMVSFEATLKQISAMRTELPIGAVAAGRLPLMLTRNCPIRNEVGCGRCTGSLTDRTGRKMPVICENREFVQILNPDFLYILDRPEELSALSFGAVLFYDESPEEVREILSGKRPEGRLTRGLYYRGLPEVL
ncbi:MAG: U32 family peptidase [Ruminococcus sp.]|nr:U32 family peptidase [Ruminococcus sp.]